VNRTSASLIADFAPEQRELRELFKTGHSNQAPSATAAAGTKKSTNGDSPTTILQRHRNPTKSVLSGLRLKLVGTMFLAVAPPLAIMYFLKLEQWAGFLVGLLALAAAWIGGERFIMRQVRVLLSTTERLAQGDTTARTGVTDTKSELGQLAHTFDSMAESLELRARERADSESLLLYRAQQQSVVAALGQFAMVNRDFNELLNQAVHLVAETLEVQFAHALELDSEKGALNFRVGFGWRENSKNDTTMEARGRSQGAFVLQQGQPVLIHDLRQERRFIAARQLLEHGVASGICLPIVTRQQPYGVLGIYTLKPRQFTGDEVQFLLAVANTLGMAAERHRTERELQKLAAFTRLNPNPAMEFSADGRITYVNNAALKLARTMEHNHPQEILPANIREIVHSCLRTPLELPHFETKVGGRTLTWSFHPVAESRVVHCYVEDSTERLSLESQLRQSQKMESIGQLAAGVAHDFNNMLTIIQGHAGMLLKRPEMPPQAADSIQAVLFASERAAGLTRQLLMFSRKNVMQPKHLDLREVVTNLSKMLQRLLGETVHLDFTPPTELPLVEGDTGMVEQIIMNLAVNARDAMEGGGTLSIGLSAVEVGEDYAQTHPDAHAGKHVCLRVSDTGCGMDTYVITRIFEPFFTTKEVGKGTGLGLATVYGIVKQHRGWVEVTSEPGQGTTFTVFFPASHEVSRSAPEEIAPTVTANTGGNETVLVVEDEPVLREMAQMILQESGYHVLMAANGKEALELWEQHRESIALLFTDMVMPAGVSGVDLATRLLAQSKQLRIVFASGYTVDDISTDFLTRNNNARFLQKPYSGITLAKAVREALDGSGEMQRTGRALAV
jgi:signal transduction histidine kinase/CheY-like chemotaxis protein/HAMP domain-containing protein